MHLKTSAKLGIAMCQKSQVMILMMFVILKFMDEQRFWADEQVEKDRKIKANSCIVTAHHEVLGILTRPQQASETSIQYQVPVEVKRWVECSISSIIST